MVVKTRIVKVGNSHGIRIPKLMLEQLGMSGPVEIEMQDDQIVVRPVRQAARKGWEEQFQAMTASGDDRLLHAGPISDSEWDEAEWEW